MTHHNQRYADRLLYAVREGTIPEADRAQAIAEAHAHATIAIAEELELANLIAAYGLFADGGVDDRLEHPLAELIIRRSIRHRLGLFPELDPTGDVPNGGDGEDDEEARRGDRR